MARPYRMGTTHTMANQFRNPDMFALVEMSGEQYVRDVEIGERLGMARPTDIRRVIESNRNEIEGFGILRSARANSGQRGRPTDEFYLNEEQAMCVAILSRAPRAMEVRRMLILTFSAFRRGQLDNSLGVLARVERLIDEKLSFVNQQIALLEERSEQRRLSDDRIALREFQSALEIIEDHAAVPSKGRHPLVNKVSRSLRDFCAAESEETGQDFGPRRCARSRTWLYPVGIVKKWWKMAGRTIVHDFLIMQRSKEQGQNVFPFVQDKKKGAA